MAEWLRPDVPKPMTRFTIVMHIEIEAPPNAVHAAVLDPGALRAWWTPEVTSTGQGIGTRLAFRFGEGGPDMEITAIEPDRYVEWRCVSGVWEGMRFRFRTEPHERGTALRFEHADWTEQGPFHGHCAAKWGFFLGVSLKRLMETGTGIPYPNEPKV